MADVEIRPLHGPADMFAAEVLQQEVWGFSPLEVVPQHVLITADHHGGLVVGAWIGTHLAGLSFSFRGLDAEGKEVLCSHLLGVSPKSRGRGLGIALKWAQRDAALKLGVERIVWTFDPLEHGNARLNTQLLGGYTNRYLVNVYGEMRDALNAGLPSDRLEIVWDLTSPRVVQRAKAFVSGQRVMGQADHGPHVDLEGPGRTVVIPEGEPRFRLAAPRDAQWLRANDPAAAIAWRMHVRSTLQASFEAGYVLTGAGIVEGAAEYWLSVDDHLSAVP